MKKGALEVYLAWRPEAQELGEEKAEIQRLTGKAFKDIVL